MRVVGIGLGRFKVGGDGYDPSVRRNLATFTEDYSNVVYSKQNTTVSGELITTTTADLLSSTVVLPTGAFVTHSERLQRVNHDWVRLTFLSGGNEVRGWFNLATGVAGTINVAGTGVAGTIGIVNDAGYWRCSISGSIPGATGYVFGTASAAGDAVFTRVTNSQRNMKGTQVELGTLTPYQPILAATFP